MSRSSVRSSEWHLWLAVSLSLRLLRGKCHRTMCPQISWATLCFCSESNPAVAIYWKGRLHCGECVVCLHSNNGFDYVADSHNTLLRDLKQRLNLLQSRIPPVLRLSQSTNGNRTCLACTGNLARTCPYTVSASIRVCSRHAQVCV